MVQYFAVSLSLITKRIRFLPEISVKKSWKINLQYHVKTLAWWTIWAFHQRNNKPLFYAKIIFRFEKIIARLQMKFTAKC